MLESYRVLDLTDEKGLLCGKVLADLGAEVIKVERPGGDEARLIPPFYHDEPHPERSLFWWAFCQGKKSFTLDLSSSEGRQLFRQLVALSDFVIESYPPGHLDSHLGLGYTELHRINPGIILVSITPFGQTGPYAGYEGADLIAMALGGYLAMCGDPDRPPVRISVPLAFPLASCEAAVGALMALYHRQATGEGQQVDVSAQQMVTRLMLNAAAWWDIQRKELKRAGQMRPELSSAEQQRQLYRCKDGWVSFTMYGGTTGAIINSTLAGWIEEEGLADDFLRSMDWYLDMSKVDRALMARIEERLERFFLTKSKAELYRGALERRVILLPVSTVDDILADPHLAARDFWVQVAHPELGRSILYPGAFAKSSAVGVDHRRRAPLVGEHNGEIYCGLLGFSKERLAALKRTGVI